ncbi:MAG TPA: CvpA family protein [Dehalococcoidia bacterium]|nr:CvpA family protein [Dehalococcoidia bacterium]
MNWLDIVIAITLIIPIFTGLKQGLIKSAISLAGLMVGVVVASNYYQVLGDRLTFITNEDFANIAAFAIILIVIMIIANVIAALLKVTAKIVLLGWVDHLGGAVFGLLMGAIFMGALLAIIVKFFGSSLIIDSFLAEILLDKFPLVLGFLPSEFDTIRDFFQAP